MKGEGFATHAPPLPYIRAMGGCGEEQSNLLSEPSKVEKKERKKEGRKAIGQERERNKKREREKEGGRRGALHDAGSARKLNKAGKTIFANFYVVGNCYST